MDTTPPDLRRTGPEESLLSGEALLSAIRGHHVGEHPLAILAREFGAMHHRHLYGIETEYDCRRNELVVAVDTWAAANLPIPHPTATVHTETLGAVIDRLARTQVHAYHLLMTVEEVTDPRVHTAWYRLAELVEGYTDLTDGLNRRSVRLPAFGDDG